ncbi:hypothetical protein GCM10009127_07710 [Alteraurantiacibacter aestuarii]|uniref:HIG1 domain-containing protein n=1 Tax=Alteraurantiacibacter aestuarii TaxID=650004 RepID=A0A844ZHX7_9SPHN|nr:HIG1 domain-containing protein [Alteraurantiacibacter aestuarii]MXO87164.1 hypothetical protein [Alteraurantiacibacter aestuarii]
MNAILVIIIVILAILVVVSLVRGIIAFLQSTKLDLESEEDDARAGRMQEVQNKMMFNRIKYQALAVLVIAVLLAVNS